MRKCVPMGTESKRNLVKCIHCQNKPSLIWANRVKLLHLPFPQGYFLGLKPRGQHFPLQKAFLATSVLNEHTKFLLPSITSSHLSPEACSLLSSISGQKWDSYIITLLADSTYLVCFCSRHGRFLSSTHGSRSLQVQAGGQNFYSSLLEHRSWRWHGPRGQALLPLPLRPRLDLCLHSHMAFSL